VSVPRLGCSRTSVLSMQLRISVHDRTLGRRVRYSEYKERRISIISSIHHPTIPPQLKLSSAQWCSSLSFGQFPKSIPSTIRPSRFHFWYVTSPANPTNAANCVIEPLFCSWTGLLLFVAGLYGVLPLVVCLSTTHTNHPQKRSQSHYQ